MSAAPLFAVDEVKQTQLQKVASLVGHIFQHTYAAILDSLINEEKLHSTSESKTTFLPDDG